MKTIEMTGKTVDEALKNALDELKLTKENVDVEIIDEGSKGLFNLIGAKPAKVRVTKKPDSIDNAKKFLTDKLEHGAISNDGAVEMVEKYLDFNKVKEKNKICYAACTKLPNFNAKYFKINDYDEEIAKKIVLASASLPLIYDSTEVLGEKYIDGGIADNVPIQPVYGEKCDIIIVVLLSKDGQIDRSLYPNSRLIIIAPENLVENAITGTLNLDTDAKRVRIIEGYNDTINKIEPIMELMNFVHKKEEERKNPTLYRTYNYLKGVKRKIDKKKKKN